MTTILLGLTPFIFITLLGFLFGRFKIFDLSHAKVLNLFLYYYYYLSHLEQITDI